MLYITMLRCRQREKDASLKYYKNRLSKLKNLRKDLKEQLVLHQDKESISQAFQEVNLELSEVKSKIKEIEAEIRDNDYLIGIEEKNLAKEAALAKERVMAARAAKSRVNSHTA